MSATLGASPLPDTGPFRAPVRLQLEAVECGAASLAMILAYHGRHVPLETLRGDCGVSRDGAKAGAILRAAREHGLIARGFRKEPAELVDIPLPAILFWNFNHFVVLEGFEGGDAWVNDPAFGRRRVPGAEFDEAFTGVALTFERGERFQPGGVPPSALRSLSRHLEGLSGPVALAVLLGLALALPGVAMPWLVGRFIDDVLAARMPGAAETLLAGLVIAALAQGLLLWLQGRVLTQAFTGTALRSATRFVKHTLSLPMDFFVQRSAGEVSARVALNDRVAEAVSADLSHVLLSLLTAAFYLVMMFHLSPGLATLAVACLAIQFVALRAIDRRAEGIANRLSVQAGRAAGLATSGLANIESIKAGGQESALFQRWLGLQAQIANTALDTQRATLLLMQVPALMSLVANVAVLAVGAIRIMQGTMTVGGLVAFQVLLAGLTLPVLALFGVARELQTLRGDVARVDDVLDHTPERGVDDAGPSASSAGPHSLAFHRVSFGYARGGPPLIEDFSLTLEAGRRVALVGGSGSGKSTLARLAAGLYHPTSGDVLFDGKPRDEWPREALARAVAYVDQDVVLFEGSVRDNLTLWDPDVADEAILRATREAGIEVEIATRPGGLGAPLEEGARNLSGGQRQRLEIARALARDPSILILDEATSALDPTTEAIVEANLRQRRIACLVIAHRLSTVRDADEIVVLHAGRVVERGTHESLMAMGGRYAALVASESGDTLVGDDA